MDPHAMSAGPADDPPDDLACATAAAAAVVDPEIPVVTIADLGILRSVTRGADGRIDVLLSPTYTACPATAVIQIDVEAALASAGIRNARVRTVLSPAWTTDWISDAGREKLRAYGIAPPPKGAGRGALLGRGAAVSCPRCGSDATEQIAAFGSTACKALWRCTRCREPFDAFKCL